MASPRVLILCDQTLFGQTIRSFIEERTHLHVIAVEALQAQDAAHVQELCPDLIVIGEEKESHYTFLPELLDLAPPVRIVRLNLEGNTIRVYDGHQLMAHRTQDLVDVLDALGRTEVESGNS